eukprot:g28496.t1
MALPPSLHRVYYRQRTNPGHTLATAQSVEWRSRCSRGSRWANYAILPHDHQQPITVEDRRMVQLSQNEDCVVTVRLLNPRVWKSDANVVSGGMSFDIFKPGILLLNETKMECNLGRMIRADVEEPGRFYVLDDRLELLEQ